MLLKTIVHDHHLKLLLMSATMNVQIFREYFGDCEMLEILGRNFNVAVLYLDEIIAVTKYEEKLDDSVEIDHKLLNHLIGHIHDSTPVNETILVFLPGIDAISEQDTLLKENAALKNFRTIILHSEVSDDKIQNQAVEFDVTDSKERTIVLATNIAETSITIPSVVHVIDCALCVCQSNEI